MRRKVEILLPNSLMSHKPMADARLAMPADFVLPVLTRGANATGVRVEVEPAAGGASVKVNRVVELSSVPTRDDINNKRVFLYVDAQVPAKGDFQVTVHAVKKNGGDFHRPDDGYVTFDPALKWAELAGKKADGLRAVPGFSFPNPANGPYTLSDEDKEEFVTFGGTDKALTAVWIEVTGGKHYCDYCRDRTADGINVWHAVFTAPPTGKLVAANTDGESVKVTLV